MATAAIFKRGLRLIAIAAGVVLLAFFAIAGWFTREASDRRASRCNQCMRPLVARRALPALVERSLQVSPETYPADRRLDMMLRLSYLRASRGTRERINLTAVRSATSRLYLADDALAWVVFYDESDRVRTYDCFSYDAD